VAVGASTYAYDGDGRRVKKVSGGETTVFIYDAMGQMAAETTSGTNASPCAVCYMSVDHLGSTKMVTDGGGAVVSLHDYLPFGQEIAGGTYGRSSLFGSGTDGVKQKFTGKERDQESGLDYFGARYYGSALGRLTSPDWSAKPQPVPYADFNNPQTLNQYVYVLNNPLSKNDPDGHCDAPSGLKPGQTGVCVASYIQTKWFHAPGER
jgi:RHS repeat-associated protein